MSLDWDASEVENYEEILDEESGESVVTRALVWQTMPVGIPKITEDNWEEFYFRYLVLEDIDGPAAFKFDKETHKKTSIVTPAAIKRRIGLRTNASKKTEAAFIKDVGVRLLRDAKMVGKHNIREEERKDETDSVL